MNQHQTEKLESLRQILRSYRKVAVAFSGGVDSICLLQEAIAALGKDNVLAITVHGDNFPAFEGNDAAEVACTLGARHQSLEWDPFTIPAFTANTEDRCYHCKKALYCLILAEAVHSGFPILADGGNASDANDYRPGSKAAQELGVKSPLARAGLEKSDIRSLLQESGNRFHDKPAIACLATRVPTGAPITREALRQIEAAESALLPFGFANIRVRHHGDLARIEIAPQDRGRFSDELLWERVGDAVRGAGYRYVALDLLGYKRGNMNSCSTNR